MAFRATDAALSQVPGLVAAGLFLCLAAWLVYLNPRSRPIRVFALLIALRGTANFLFGFSNFFGDFGTSKTLVLASDTGFFIIPFVALYFVSIYPYRRGWIGTRPLGYWSMIGMAVALLALYFIDPSLYASQGPRPDGTAREVTAGPLRILGGLLWLLYSIMVFILVRDYVRTPVRPLRRSVLLVAMGFGLHVAYVSAFATYHQLTNSWGPQPITGPIIETTKICYMLALPVLVSTIIYLARHASTETERAERRLLNFWLVTVAAVIVLALVAFLISPEISEPGFRYDSVLGGIVSMALPILVAYALIKHQIFDIDLKIQWTLKQGTVAAAFLAAFIVSTQLAQSFFQWKYSSWVAGGMATGLMLLALSPLQRVADRIANAAMPTVKNTDEWKSNRRVDCYKSAIAMALKDRVLTRDEERTLALLADELGIGHTKALELREEVERELHPTSRARRPAAA